MLRPSFIRITKSTRLLSCCSIRPASSNAFTLRSHNCGELTLDHVGKRVTLYGWIKYKRLQNTFLTLQDCYGTTQVILRKDVSGAFRKSLTNESVIKVDGIVKKRPPGQSNQNTKTGEIEVAADHFELLSLAKADLPILSKDHIGAPTENVKLQYRYLHLRSEEMQKTLRFRSKLCQMFREKLTNDFAFVECETPTLFKRTPGGASEFLVPTRIPGKFYSLVQSPQQLKQLLMIGQTDRYFQLCRCYRDEAIRPDRQPEFTQLDIELSFTSQENVMELVESLLKHVWPLVQEYNPSFADSDPFRYGRLERMSYSDAMAKYGTDKPDTRFGAPCKFLWITNFPLFTKDDEGVLVSNHHPFTSPSESTTHYLWSDPAKVIGQHYDLVMNGQEVAGGSIRIHNYELQRYIFEQILQVKPHVFKYFIDALHSGCPPHGGIAFGLDRLVSLFLGKPSIREVIAFPKSTTGRDVMTDCPDYVDDELRSSYHLGPPPIET